MTSIKLVFTFLLIVIITGCAVGNQYDYSNVNVSLPLNGSGEIGLGVIDNRAYVLNGDKPSNFIGLQRGGFANPFDVKTRSGNSLSEDMLNSLGRALTQSGFTVTNLSLSSTAPSVITSTLGASGKNKNVILTVTDWKTDVYMNVTLHFNLDLQIMDKSGVILANHHLSGKESIGGGGMQGHNSRTAQTAFESKIGTLFNQPEVKAVLNN